MQFSTIFTLTCLIGWLRLIEASSLKNKICEGPVCFINGTNLCDQLNPPQLCCDDRIIYPKDDFTKCCRGSERGTYRNDRELCNNKSIIPKSGSLEQCGPDMIFDSAIEVCQSAQGTDSHDRIYCKEPKTTAKERLVPKCGRHKYNPETHICCQKMLHEKIEGASMSCCGVQAFDEDTHSCCHQVNVLEKESSGDCCRKTAKKLHFLLVRADNVTCKGRRCKLKGPAMELVNGGPEVDESPPMIHDLFDVKLPAKLLKEVPEWAGQNKLRNMWVLVVVTQQWKRQRLTLRKRNWHTVSILPKDIGRTYTEYYRRHRNSG